MDRDCIVSFLLKNDFLIYLWRLFHLGNWYDVIGKNYLWLSIFPVCRIWAHWRAQWKDQGRRGHHGEVQTDLPAPLTAGHIQKRDHTSLLWGDPDWRKVCGFSQNIGKMNIQTFCQLWLTWQNIDRSWLCVALEHIWCLKNRVALTSAHCLLSNILENVLNTDKHDTFRIYSGMFQKKTLSRQGTLCCFFGKKIEYNYTTNYLIMLARKYSSCTYRDVQENLST